MATIAKLVIQSVLDPSGVNRGVKQVIDQIAALEGVSKKRRELNLTFPKLKIAEDVQRELAKLQRDFDAEIVGGKEGLARKIIKPEEFRKTGIQAAQEFDKGILSMVDNLRAKKQLTPTLHKALISQLKTSGLEGGKALTSGLSKSIAAHPLLGNLTTTGQRAANTLLNGLNKTYNQKINQLREDFANKSISVQAFRTRAREAADAFDKGISDGLNKLRTKKQATGDITEALVSSYKLAGLKAANAFNLSVSKQLGENISSVGRTMTRAVTLPIVAAGAAAIKLGADFELSMNRVQAITEATGAEMDKLAAQARKLGAESQFSAKDAAEAQAVLAQQSLNVQEILGLMPTVLNVAAASLISMSEAASQSTKILKAFAIPVGDMGDKMDELVKLSLIARTTLGEVADAMKFAAPAAVRLGQSFETVGAAIGALAQRGLPATLAGTTLRGILTALIKPSREASKALKDLQINAFNADGTMKDLVDVVKQFEIAQKRAGNDKQFNQRVQAIFQQRAGTGFATLLTVGSKALDDMRKKLDSAGSTAKRVGDTQMRGAIGAFREFISAVQELALAVTDSGLLKFITDLTRNLASLLLMISKTNPGLLKFVTQFLLFAAVLGPVLLTLGKLTTQFAIVRAILIALNSTAGFAGLASFLATGGAVIVGLGLLAAIVAKVAVNLAKARKELEDFNEVLQTQTLDQLEKTKQELQNSIDFNKTLLKTLQDAEAKKMKDPFFVGKGLTGGSPEIQNVLNVLDQQKKKLAAIDVQMAKIKATGQQAGKALDAVGKTPLDQLKTDIDAIVDALGDLNLSDTIGGETKSVVDTVGDSIDLLIKSAKQFGSELREQPRLVAALQNAYTLVNNLLDKQKDKLSKEAVQLRDMQADLEAIFQSAEFKFAKIPQKELAFQLGLDDPLPLQVVPILGVGMSGIDIKTTLQRVVDDFQKQAKKTIGAKLDLDIATRLGNTQDIKKFGKIYEDALSQASIAENVLKNAIFESNLSLEEKQKLWDELKKTIDEYDKKQTAAEKRAQKLETRLHGMADAVRGISSIAQAIGSISQEAADALDAVADLADSLANMFKSMATGDLFGSISSAIGAVGSLIKLGKSLFGKDPGEAERKKIINDNTTALRDAARALDGFKVSVAKIRDVQPITNAIVQNIKTALAKFGRGSFSDVQFKSVEELDKQLRAAGSSFEELQAIAKDLGINLFNEKGRLSAAGLDALNKAMDLQIRKLTEFGNTLDDTRDRLELRRNVLNLDTSGLGSIQDSLTLLDKFAPGIRAMLGNFDIKTETGRAQLEKAVQQFFLNLENGLIDKKLFANISIEELTGIIKTLADSFDELRQSSEEATHAVSNIPQGFKIERARFQATLTDIQQAALASSRLTSKVREAKPTEPPSTDAQRLADMIEKVLKGGAKTDTATGAPTPVTLADLQKLAQQISDATAAGRPVQSDFQKLADEIASAVQKITITVQPPAPAAPRAASVNTSISQADINTLPDDIAASLKDVTLTVKPVSTTAASPDVNVAAPNVAVPTVDFEKMADTIARAVEAIKLVVDTTAPTIGTVTADISQNDITAIADSVKDAIRSVTVAVDATATAALGATDIKSLATAIASAIQSVTLTVEPVPVTVQPNIVIDNINFQRQADIIAAAIRDVTLTVTPTPVTVSAPQVTIDDVNFQREANQIADAISKVTLTIEPTPVTVNPNINVESINFERLATQIADAVQKVTLTVEPVAVDVNPAVTVNVDTANFKALADLIVAGMKEITFSVAPVPVQTTVSVTVDETNFQRLADEIAAAVAGVTLNVEQVPVTVSPVVSIDEVASFQKLADQIASAMKNVEFNLQPVPVTVEPVINVESQNISELATQISTSMDRVVTAIQSMAPTVTVGPSVATVDAADIRNMASQVAAAVRDITVNVSGATPTTAGTTSPAAAPAPVSNVTNNTMNFDATIVEATNARSLYNQLRQIAIDQGRAKKGPDGVKAVTEVWP